jgi:hypothetical protein
VPEQALEGDLVGPRSDRARSATLGVCAGAVDSSIFFPLIDYGSQWPPAAQPNTRSATPPSIA